MCTLLGLKLSEESESTTITPQKASLVKWQLSVVVFPHMSDKTTITIDTKTAENIFSEITSMQKKLALLKKQLATLLPAPYGSDAWWEKETKEGLADIKAGRSTRITNKKELKAFFDAL